MLDFLLDVISAIVIATVVLLFAMSLSFLPLVMPGGSGGHANTAVNTVRAQSAQREQEEQQQAQQQVQQQAQQQEALQQFQVEQEERRAVLGQQVRELNEQIPKEMQSAWADVNDQYRSGQQGMPDADTQIPKPGLYDGWLEDLRADLRPDDNISAEDTPHQGACPAPAQAAPSDDSAAPSQPMGACRIAPPDDASPPDGTAPAE